MEYIKVRSARPGTVALWEKDPAHPNGEAYVAGDRPVRVGFTRAVADKIHRGDLIVVGDAPDDQIAADAQEAPGGAETPAAIETDAQPAESPVAPQAVAQEEDFAPTSGDDLTVIDGIGPGRAANLNAQGIYTLEQLAEVEPERIAGAMGRVSVDEIRQWAAEAAALVATD